MGIVTEAILIVVIASVLGIVVACLLDVLRERRER